MRRVAWDAHRVYSCGDCIMDCGKIMWIVREVVYGLQGGCMWIVWRLCVECREVVCGLYGGCMHNVVWLCVDCD